MKTERLKYLKLLASGYPNAREASKEVVMLSAVLNLTKGTEVFLSDVHGEFEAFQHLIRNGSGVIKDKIIQLFGEEMDSSQINRLASVVYYPEEKIELIRKAGSDMSSFYRDTILKLTVLCRELMSIYSSKKLRKLLPTDYHDVVMELVSRLQADEVGYSSYLLDSVIETGLADRVIEELALFIQRLAVRKIHIIGDIYDRGPGAEIIMDELTKHQSVDMQWGNHDIVWMGAACGSEACMANVLRLSLRYGNTDTLETGYGIHLIPLASFAIEHYKEDKGFVFEPKTPVEEVFNTSEQWLNRLMHKAISIIQFKLEGQLIMRRSEFDMEDRLLLTQIDFEAGTVFIDGKSYPLNDTFFPTIDPADPYKLTQEERQLVDRLKQSFLKSDRLLRHADFLFEKGGMYKVTNDNLLYHGCIPLTEKGGFQIVDLGKGEFQGRSLMDFFDSQMTIARSGIKGSAERQYAVDLIWYLWAGPMSPIFGKNKMATFERYFLSDLIPQREIKDPYYQHREDPLTCRMILSEFGLDADRGVILNGHVPVSVRKGESPVKAEGKLVVIDGGFSKAYQKETGIAGYTLIHNERGRQLIAHQAFESRSKAIAEELDIAFHETVLTQSTQDMLVRDLPDAQSIIEKINDLKELVQCYKTGLIKEIRST